jgi:hypothetical protein
MSVSKLIAGQHSCVGHLSQGDSTPAEHQAALDKKAMIVYCGKFQSMDGEVEITEAHCDQLIANHNAKLEAFERSGQRDTEFFSKMPPLQLDHSTSARDTVGRVAGKLSKGTFKNQDGLPVTCVNADRIVVLGKGNVEHVVDGRWANVSIGADLEAGVLNELSITPFPAAPNAALLSRKRMNDWKTHSKGSYKGYPYQIETDDNQFFGYVDNIDFQGVDAKAVLEQIKKYIDSKPANLAGPPGEKTVELPGKVDEAKWSEAKKAAKKSYPDKPEDESFWKIVTTIYKNEGGEFHSEGDKMAETKDELKARHMKEKESLAAAHTDELKSHKLEEVKGRHEEQMKALSEKHDAEMKKLGVEEVKKDEAGDPGEVKKHTDVGDEPELKAKMAAMRPKLVTLAKSIRSGVSSGRLAAREQMITAKVARLRAGAKMTPAEQKKIDLAALSKSSDSELEAFFKGYEIREDVIDSRFHGTTKALSLANLQKFSADTRLKVLEAEARMSGIGAPMTDDQRKDMAAAESLPMSDPQKAAGAEGGWEHMMKHLAGLLGEHQFKDAVLEHVKKMMDMKHLGEMAPEHAENTEKQMSALVKEYNKLQTEVQDLTAMVGEAFGIQKTELE